MSQTTTSNQLVLREYPFFLWIFGGAMIALGLFFLFQGESSTAGIVVIVFGVVFGILLPAVNTVVVDRPARMVTITNRWIYRKKVNAIPMDEIAGVEVDSSQSYSNGKRSTTYRVVLRMQSGEITPLQGFYSSGYRSKEQKARKLSEYIGLPGPTSFKQAVRQAIRPLFQSSRQGADGGVNWYLQTSMQGMTPLIRWVSTQFTWPGDFLLIAQKPRGSGAFMSGSGLVASLSLTVYKQMIGMYGFEEFDTPGIETAELISCNDASLDENFTAFTSNPGTAPRFLKPYIASLLMRWAENHPMRAIQTGGNTQAGQLVVLLSPRGLYLITFSGAGAGEELVQLGVDLVRELPAGGI